MVLLLRLEWALILALALGVISCRGRDDPEPNVGGDAAMTVPRSEIAEGGGDAPDGPSPAGDVRCAASIDWQDAATHEGELTTVRGRVLDVRQQEGESRALILEVGSRAPEESGVDVIVLKPEFDEFPEAPGPMYGGDVICVSGIVTIIDGRARVAAHTAGIFVVATDGEVTAASP